MSNGTITTTLKIGRGAWNKYQTFRDKQVARTYDALVDAAGSYDDVTDELRERGGQLARQARNRLERAQRELSASTKDFRHEAERAQKEAMSGIAKARKLSKRTLARAEEAGREAAERSQRRLNKKLGRSRDRGKTSMWVSLGVAAGITAAVAAVTYWWQTRPSAEEAPAGTTPPRVEEVAAPVTSELVYSTETGDDEHQPQHALREDDEQLGEDVQAEFDRNPEK